MFRKKVTSIEFIQAAYDGKLDVVQRYIEENKGNVDAINAANTYGNTALIWAANKGHAPIVSALLAVPGIAINAANQVGGTALIRAAHNGHAPIVSALLAVPGIAINAATNTYGNTALIWAAHNGHAPIVSALLAVPGIAINAANQVGDTALILAAYKGHAPIVSALLAVPGIAINAAGEYGNTALIWAAHNGHAPIVSALLAVPGIAINATNTDGNTALICAANKGHAPIVSALLAVPGIAINAANQVGNTALIWAANKGHAPIVSALLASLADITIKNKKGEAAEVLAKDDAIREMIKNSTLEKKLDAAWNMREAIIKKYDSISEEQKTEQQKQEEQKAIQELANLSMLEISKTLNFLQNNLHKIKDITALKGVTFDFANLAACLGRDYESFSHALYYGAADMGHELAAGVVARFLDIRDADVMRVVEDNSRNLQSAASSSSLNVDVFGLFGSLQNAGVDKMEVEHSSSSVPANRSLSAANN